MPEDNKSRRSHLVDIAKMPHPHWASWCALLVSVVTAFVLIWQGWETRSFYRKSLVPLVNPFITDSTLKEELGIFLQNNGGGPGFVTINETLLDNEAISLKEVIDQMQSDGVIEQTSKNKAVRRAKNETFAMHAGRVVPLMVFPTSIVKVDSYDDAVKFQSLIHKRINIKFTVCSVYGECVQLCTAQNCKDAQQLGSASR